MTEQAENPAHPLLSLYFSPTINIDGLVKSPIYFVVGLKRQLAVPYVLPNCRFRHYASYIELFPESIPTH